MKSWVIKLIVLLCVLAYLFTALASAATVAHANNSSVVITVDELDPALQAAVNASAQPVVIEFFDPQDPDGSGECAKQAPEFQSAQRHLSGKATLLRADVNAQNKNMIARARIAVCPTHLFVLERNGDTLVAKRIWGYLSEDQLTGLVDEFYGSRP